MTLYEFLVNYITDDFCISEIDVHCITLFYTSYVCARLVIFFWCDYIIDCSCYSEENKNRHNFLCATAWITIAAKSDVRIAITFSLLMQMPRFTYYFNSFNLLFKAVPNLVQNIAFEKNMPVLIYNFITSGFWTTRDCVRLIEISCQSNHCAWVAIQSYNAHCAHKAYYSTGSNHTRLTVLGSNHTRLTVLGSNHTRLTVLGSNHARLTIVLDRTTQGSLCLDPTTQGLL